MRAWVSCDFILIGALRNVSTVLVMLATVLASIPGCADSRNGTARPDLEVLAQLVLDLDAMNGYFHADKLPERIPLVVIQNQLVGPDLKLSKFGQPVVFMDKTNAQKNKRAHIELTHADIQPAQATIQFVYPAEGIAGTVSFTKSGKDWRVEKYNIVER